MDDSDLHSMWLTLDRLSSIIETTHNRGLPIDGIFDIPTLAYSAADKNWEDPNDPAPLSIIILTKTNGHTLEAKNAVLDELKAKVEAMRSSISSWKVAFSSRDKNIKD